MFPNREGNTIMEKFFTQDNTVGYSEETLDMLNRELSSRLEGVEKNSDEWYQIISAFSDGVDF